MTLELAQRFAVRRYYHVYRNSGTDRTGKWVYQPWDYDSSFELWSEGFKTKQAAEEAAWLELENGELDNPQAAMAAGPHADWKEEPVPEPKDRRNTVRHRPTVGNRGHRVLRSGKPSCG